MNSQTLHEYNDIVMLILNDHIKSADFTEIAVVQCEKCVVAEVVLCGRHAINVILTSYYGQYRAGIRRYVCNIARSTRSILRLLHVWQKYNFR